MKSLKIPKLSQILMNLLPDSTKKELLDELSLNVYNSMINKSADDIVNEIIENAKIKANDILNTEKNYLYDLVKYYPVVDMQVNNTKLEFFNIEKVSSLTRINFEYNIKFPLDLSSYKYHQFNNIKEFYDFLTAFDLNNDDIIGVSSIKIDYQFRMFGESYRKTDTITDYSKIVSPKDFYRIINQLKQKLTEIYPEYII